MKRFWDKVRKADGCWEWMASRHPDGYGMFNLGGANIKAHRVAYMLSVAPIPNGLHVCHHCDNRSCVRPDHLFLGTHRDNMADRHAKGRSIGSPGEAHPFSKLTDEDVRQMRLLSALGITGKWMAGVFGVAAATAQQAINGRRWRHVKRAHAA